MKKVVFAAIAFVSLANSAFAAGTPLPAAGFNVTATLTAKCRYVSPASTPTIDFGVYTAFSGPANATPSADLVFECTKNHAPVSAVLDATTGTVVGVTYNLTMTSATSAGTAGSEKYTYTVGGTMVANQAGDQSAPTTDARTLTISY